jgi:hypothetical protein
LGERIAGSTYERLLLIGRGGMGEVFLGRQLGPEGFRRAVALKRVLPGHSHDPELRRMFIAEANIMAGLGHPNLCQTVELCALDDDLFLVLEYLDGVTLAALLAEVRALPTELLGAILVQACAGLEHAHGKGLVHRDLSPSNLFITGDGLVKILDFGVAKVDGADRSSSGLKGKSPYMSPEQVTLQSVDARSDLFALGALGMEALTGVPLFLRGNDFLTYQAILEDTRPVRLTPSPLDPVLAACLSVEPAGRPESARALAQAVRGALHAAGGEASQHDLAEYVEHHMAGALRATRERVQAALAAPSGAAAPVILRTLQLQVGAARPAPERQEAASGRRRSVVTIALVAVAVVGAFAIGLVAAGDRDQVARSSAPEPAAVPDAAATSPTPAPPTPSTGTGTGTGTIDAGPVDAGQPRRPRTRGTGHLSVDSSPFAVLWIDGKKVGTTPLLRHALPEGTHRVRARTEDGRTRRLRVRVRAGHHTVERISF